MSGMMESKICSTCLTQLPNLAPRGRGAGFAISSGLMIASSIMISGGVWNNPNAVPYLECTISKGKGRLSGEFCSASCMEKWIQEVAIPTIVLAVLQE